MSSLIDITVRRATHAITDGIIINTANSIFTLYLAHTCTYYHTSILAFTFVLTFTVTFNVTLDAVLILLIVFGLLDGLLIGEPIVLGVDLGQLNFRLFSLFIFIYSILLRLRFRVRTQFIIGFRLRSHIVTFLL